MAPLEGGQAAAERRACRAISRSGAGVAGVQPAAIATRYAAAQEARPAAGGLPVAVVLAGGGGADDEDMGRAIGWM
jgi:hypothetical protein